MLKTKILGLLILLLSYGVFQAYKYEVDSKKFTVSHRIEVKTIASKFYNFVTQAFILEKLLPWLSMLREADSRISMTGKLLTAVTNMPLFGNKRIYLNITVYNPPNNFVIESKNWILKQRVEIRTEQNLDKTILHVKVVYRSASALFQYTVGILLRHMTIVTLNRSLKEVAMVYENITPSFKYT